VAVAGGRAFSFAYAETVELLDAAGAEVRPFDPLTDEHLPAGTGAVLVGGGFPEVYAQDLAANEPLRAEVAAFAAAGGPIAAECAGLLWLCRSLDGAPMCGVLPTDARMTGSLRIGYRDAALASSSWFGPASFTVTGHEFHRTVVEPDHGSVPAWLWRGGRREGFMANAVHASYLHVHWAAIPEAASRLVMACV
jgi:cobyrinic acid a,c-diamide synthase